MPDPVLTPSTSDPTWTAVIFTLIRSVVMLGSSLGLVHGVYSDSTLQVVAGGAVAVGTSLWGVWDKYQAAKKDHEGSVESAKLGMPQRVL